MGSHSQDDKPPVWHPEATWTPPIPPQAPVQAAYQPYGWQQAQPPFTPPPQQPPPGYYQYPPAPQEQPNIRLWLGVVALVLAGVGALLQLQSVSLLTGDGIYWTGGALTVVGAALSFANGRTWIKAVCIVLAVLCTMNVIYAEKQLSDKRHEIQQDFNNLD